MNEPFIIQVNYQGTEQEFRARFERWGYTHRIAVLIGETTVTFEPDEEGGYRAMGDGQIKVDLLRTIAEKLTELNRSSA